MKVLAWYTAILMGLLELYFLGEIIDGGYIEDTFTQLFTMAMVAPPIVFSILFLFKKK